MKKKLIALLCCAAMVVGVMAACGPKAKETPQTEAPKSEAPKTEASKSTGSETIDMNNLKIPAKDVKIQMVSKGFQHAFWQAVKKGAEDEVQKLGMTPSNFAFTGPNSESETAQQMQLLASAMAGKPSVVCFAALDPKAAKEAMGQAKSDGIPVIGFDSGVVGAPAGSVLATAATDNKAAGAKDAEELYNLLKSKIDSASSPIVIGVASQDATSDSVISRTVGFLDKMTEIIGADKSAITGFDKYKKGDEKTAKVLLDVAIPANTGDPEMAAAVTPILQKSNCIGFYASNEGAAKGLLNADQSLSKLGKSVLAVGFDSGEIQLTALKDGRLAGAITQDPYQIGSEAIRLAFMAAQGMPVQDLAVPFHYYTKDTLTDPVISRCLYK